jgi:hypothetical protein
VTQAIRAQQHVQRDAPPHEALRVLDRWLRHDDRARGVAARKSVQQLIDVRGAARLGLLVDRLLVGGMQLGDPRVQVLRIPEPISSATSWSERAISRAARWSSPASDAAADTSQRVATAGG